MSTKTLQSNRGQQGGQARQRSSQFLPCKNDRRWFFHGVSRLRSGFTILELLTVITIISVVAFLSVQAVGGLMLSRGMGTALDQSAALLELARNEAVTRQSYVWVAIKEETVDGKLETQMAAFYSADGTTNDAADNIIPLVKTLRITGVGLVPFSELRPETRNLWSSTLVPSELLDNNDGMVFRVLPLTPFENNNTITFTPRGEMMLLGQPGVNDGFDPAVALGFVPARGATKLTNRDDGAIILDGSTGAVRKFRM